ncbi:MAG: hypothetical protein Q4A98_05980 [Comamonadaceae bacterium]|nr:hypothetical protein [Comamonadaceae bacterium]
MKTVPLAPDHKGMKVCYQGLIDQSRKAMKRDHPLLAETLRQLKQHLTELGQRWYAGDQMVVDEFLQLYCIEEEAREAVKQAKANQISRD